MRLADIMKHTESNNRRYNVSRSQRVVVGMVENVVGANVTDLLAPYVDTDTDYSGITPWRKYPVLCISRDVRLSDLYKVLLQNEFEYMSVVKPEFKMVRHITSSNDLSTWNTNCGRAYVGINLFGSELFLLIDHSMSDMRNFVQDCKDLSAGNKDFVKYKVENIIHNARTRVLGDKYVPDLMYTELM